MWQFDNLRMIQFGNLKMIEQYINLYTNLK